MSDAEREKNQDADQDVGRPIANGPNARPRDEPIGQSSGGLPDDSSKPVDIDPEEERRIAEQIRSL